MSLCSTKNPPVTGKRPFSRDSISSIRHYSFSNLKQAFFGPTKLTKLILKH